MQGGRFCNLPRVPPATHALYSNLPEAGVQETWRISKQYFILVSKQSAHKTPTLKYFLFVHNTAIFCCFETSHWWCTSFYGVAPETWRIEMKYFLSSQNNPHNVFVQCLVRYITMHQSFDTRWCNCFDAPVSCLCPRCCTRAKSFRPRSARLPQTSPLDNGSHDGQWPAYDRI